MHAITTASIGRVSGTAPKGHRSRCVVRENMTLALRVVVLQAKLARPGP
jgi:hypothetical protein